MRLPADGFGPPGGGGGGGDGEGRREDHQGHGQQSSPSAPAINAPPIVLGLAAGLVAIFALMNVQTEAVQDQIVVYGALWPGRFTGNVPFETVLNHWIAASSLITYSFLHGSWTHVLLNAVWLLAFGAPVARRLGTTRFLILFFLSGLGGASLHLALHWGQPVPVLGASACVAGLTGALVRFAFRQNRPAADVSGPLSGLTDRGVVMFVAIWFGINLLTGLLSLADGSGQGIAWEAHVGGFLVGLIGMPLLDPPARLDPLFKRIS